MSPTLDRRALLKAVAATSAIGLVMRGGQPALAAEKGLKFGDAFDFSFDTLKQMAARMSRDVYVGPSHPDPEILQQIDYDAWGKISYDTDLAVFANGPGKFPVTFFHLGRFFQKAVQMHVVDGGKAREIVYSSDYFKMPADSVAHKLPEGAGFAGLRIQEARDSALDWRKNDWVAFLGASYLRSIGELHQYGLSARGLAVDTAVYGKAEEFPDFTQIFIQTPEKDSSDSLTLFALLDSPSVTGAYRFEMTRAADVVMDIDVTLYPRAPISRFGIAPLTSMYWFSETAKPTAIDWRPEIHDSDGLALYTGVGEHIWRPLNNPPHITASAFGDENPRGFGLLQRDRNFDHYQDGVYYDRRPSAWVEPKGSWGKGAVQLIELPTDDEIHDNIVAMWVPEETPAPGSELSYGYRLYWSADEPDPTPLARCVATRLSNGGQPGQPRPRGVRKFMVEFLGGPLTDVPFGVKPKIEATTSRGTFTDYQLVEAVPDGVAGHWRAQFDLAGVEGTEPVEIRLFLSLDGKPATETWLFQYHPF